MLSTSRFVIYLNFRSPAISGTVALTGAGLLIIGHRFQMVDSQGVGVGGCELRFEGGGEILPVQKFELVHILRLLFPAENMGCPPLRTAGFHVRHSPRYFGLLIWEFGRAKLDVGLTRVQECHPSATVSVKIRRSHGADFWDVGRFEGLGELGKAGYGSEYLVKSVVTFCLAGPHVGHCLLHCGHSVFFHG